MYIYCYFQIQKDLSLRKDRPEYTAPVVPPYLLTTLTNMLRRVWAKLNFQTQSGTYSAFNAGLRSGYWGYKCRIIHARQLQRPIVAFLRHTSICGFPAAHFRLRPSCCTLPSAVFLLHVSFCSLSCRILPATVFLPAPNLPVHLSLSGPFAVRLITGIPPSPALCECPLRFDLRFIGLTLYFISHYCRFHCKCQ